MNELRNVRPFSREGKKDEELDGLVAFALTPVSVPADFVARVMRGLPREPGRRETGPGLWKWAAALLIFSVALGYGFSTAEQATESVASLTSTPSDSVSSLLGTL
jgi:hypothetical protein